MRFVLLLIAAVVAVVAGVAALQLSNKSSHPVVQQAAAPQPASPNPGVSTAQVLVARQPIAVGTVITDAMIDKQPWPENLVLDGFITEGSKDASALVGKVARASFQAREPFLTSKVVSAGEFSYLASSLPAGMRAVTIATDAVAGVAGYIFPGDHIDVLFTHNLPKDIRANRSETPAPGNEKPAYSEVLVPNALVLAINVRDPSTKDGSSATITPTSMTLAVDAGQVQKLRLAEKTGTLALALRSVKDRKNEDIPPPTTLASLSNIHVLSDNVIGEPEVKIVRGAGKEEGSITNVPAK